VTEGKLEAATMQPTISPPHPPPSHHHSIFSVAYSHATATRFAAHSSINFAVAAPVASYLLSIN